MRVVVLVSTYQGEKYVAQQLRSVLEQLPPEGRIVVRDDGSADATVRQIQELRDARIEIHAGPNVGFVRSFFWLIQHAPRDADMVMLCDQDDVWLPSKIERAWAVIGRSGDVPTLYCSRLELVDEDLHPMGYSPCWPRTPSFSNAVTENVVTGCTSALNPAAVRLFSKIGDPARIYFHDWWLYLVVSAFGVVHFDPEPTILYRQHRGNAIGMSDGWRRYWTILRFLRKRNWIHIMFNQLENFREVHGSALPEGQRELLRSTFDPRDWRAMARLILLPRRLRQTLVSDALFRAILVADIVTGRGLLPKPSR